jgi:hypothetical protein
MKTRRPVDVYNAGGFSMGARASVPRFSCVRRSWLIRFSPCSTRTKGNVTVAAVLISGGVRARRGCADFRRKESRAGLAKAQGLPPKSQASIEAMGCGRAGLDLAQGRGGPPGRGQAGGPCRSLACGALPGGTEAVTGSGYILPADIKFPVPWARLPALFY